MVNGSIHNKQYLPSSNCLQSGMKTIHMFDGLRIISNDAEVWQRKVCTTASINHYEYPVPSIATSHVLILLFKKDWSAAKLDLSCRC